MPEEFDDREENAYGNEQDYDNGRKRNSGLCPETDGAGRTAGKYCVYGETERTGFGVCRYDR